MRCDSFTLGPSSPGLELSLSSHSGVVLAAGSGSTSSAFRIAGFLVWTLVTTAFGWEVASEVFACFFFFLACLEVSGERLPSSDSTAWTWGSLSFYFFGNVSCFRLSWKKKYLKKLKYEDNTSREIMKIYEVYLCRCCCFCGCFFFFFDCIFGCSGFLCKTFLCWFPFDNWKERISKNNYHK